METASVVMRLQLKVVSPIRPAVIDSLISMIDGSDDFILLAFGLLSAYKMSLLWLGGITVICNNIESINSSL